MEAAYVVNVPRFRPTYNALTFSGPADIPLEETMNPKKVTWLDMKENFLRFATASLS